MLLHGVVAELHEHSRGGGRSVEDGHTVSLDYRPPRVGGGIVGRPLEHYRGGALDQRPKDDVAVACHPAYIGSAVVDILVLDVEYLLHRRVQKYSVPSVVVDYPLRPTRRPRGVQDVQGMVALQSFRLHTGCGGYRREQVVQPDVPPLTHLHFEAHPPDDDHVLDYPGGGGGLVGGLLQPQHLPSPVEAIRGDQNLRLEVLYPQGQVVSAEAAEDDAEYDAQPSECEQDYRQLRDHRHVDGGPVPAHQTEFTSEGESDAIDFPPQVVVGVLPHLPGVARLVTRLSLPDESNLVLPRAPHVPVKAEVRDVGLRAREPRRYVRMLSIFEDGPPRLEPLQLPRGIRPELPEVLDSASKVSLVIFDCRRSPAPIRELDPLFEGQRLTDEGDLFHLPSHRRLPI